VRVWSAPEKGRNSQNVWAPELHLVAGRWYVYYAADDGHPENRRMWVLEAESSNPFGRYRCQGALETGGWATDGTVMSLDSGQKYFVWSGKSSKKSNQQDLYIAPMRNPLAIAGAATRLAVPDQPWERVAQPVCERPQVLRRNHDLFIVYSASASWTPDCCLGLLHNRTQDVLNPDAWVKHGPVFRNHEHVLGIGHCSFVTSLCQTEHWIIYRPKTSNAAPGESNQVFAHRFDWSSDGLPAFGEPVFRSGQSFSPLKRSVRMPQLDS